MTESSAISHQINREPDWTAIKLLPDNQAAEALRSILLNLEGAEECIFARRGLALLMFEERELYKEFVDPEYGVPFASMDRWLKISLPKSWRYCTDAKNTILAVRAEIQPKDLFDIKRCNLEQLKKVSSSVRILPEVVQAAKVLPEKEFISELNEKYDQHLERHVPLVMAPAEVCATFEQAVDRVIIFYGCTRAEALEYIGHDILEKYPIEQEKSA
jgi:hypothetical protein